MGICVGGNSGLKRALQKAFKKSAFLKRPLNKRSKKTPKTPA
jgi:hypothetical protein